MKTLNWLLNQNYVCLTYRYVPKTVQALLTRAVDNHDTKTQDEINLLVGKLTKFIQKRQREDGRSFVSRTRIEVARYGGEKVIVFRVVLANPLTNKAILHDILAEQCLLAQESQQYLPKLLAISN